MSRQLKTLISDTLRAQYEGVDEACVMDITGLNTQDTVQVRRALTSKSLRAMVV